MDLPATTTRQTAEEAGAMQMRSRMRKDWDAPVRRTPLIRPQNPYLSSFHCGRFQPVGSGAQTGAAPGLNSAEASVLTAPPSLQPYELVFRADDMSLSGRTLIDNVKLPEQESSRPGLRKRSLSGTEACEPDSKKARIEAAGEQAVRAEPVCTDTKKSGNTTAPASDTPWQGKVDSELLHLLSDLLSHGFFLHEINDIGVVLMTRTPRQVIHGGFHVQIKWETLSAVDSPAALSGLALQHLIAHGNLKAVDYLIRHGAALLAHHAADAALVRQAALEGRTQLLDALLRLGADIVTPDANGRCLLHHAVDAGIADVVALLCVPGAADQPDRNGDTPLLLAIREKKGLDICAALLRRGVDPDCRDREGQTALTTAIAKYDNMAVAALLRAGANPNLADGLLETPLHLACANGNEEAAMMLLGKGCATDRTDALGRTALDIAMQTDMEADVLELLRYCTSVES